MALFKKNKRININNSEAVNTSINKNTYKNHLVKAISLIKGASDGRESFSAPEYDLYEIKVASESDSYIKSSLMKYSYMLFKAGYLLKSENEKASDYIKTRFHIMGFATGIPMDILFQQVGDDLIKYSNAFLVKSRVDNIMPGVKAKGFYKDKPVGGYFRVDPASIYIERDKFGTIKKYVQSVDGAEKKFDVADVIHFYLDKDAANAFGTPRIIAAIEDVKILRRIEGNVLAMIYRFSMPLYQWIIGLPQTGFQATNKEIDQAKYEIENMALDGSVVTNEKTQIKVVGAEGNALNAEGYLKYFEQRVFSALGVSESQMGRGGSKQDADSMESQAHDTVKHIQKTFAIFTQNFIINELLLEGGFNPVLNQNDAVEFSFNEINIETKIKVENHEMAKFQSNMISFEEMRREIGKKEKIKEDRLYKNLIEVSAEETLTKLKADESIRIVENTKKAELKNAKALAKENAKIQSETSNNSVSTSSQSTGSGAKKISHNGNGTSKSQAPNKDIASKNTPENQYGKTSVKVKEQLNLQEKTIRDKAKHKKTFVDIYNKYNKLSNDIKENTNDKDVLMSLAYDNILADMKVELQSYSQEAIEKARADIKKKNKGIANPNVSVSLIYFEDEVEKGLKKILDTIDKSLKEDMTTSEIEEVFNTFEYRIRYMLEFVLPKVYWYSYLKTGQAYGYIEAEVDFDGSDDELDHPKEIDLNALDIDEIPPYHPFCDCKITFKKGDISNGIRN